MTEKINNASFAAYHDASTEEYYALTPTGQWKADSTIAVFAVDENGEIISKDDPTGISIMY